MRILVADDNEIMRVLIENIIMHWDYEVVSAKDGEEAWEILQQEDSPRIALLDWEMPGMDGIELCQHIRKREKDGARYTYILLLTARDNQKDIIAGMEAGADDYVVKPFNQYELHARVRSGQRIVELQTELYRMKEEFYRLSRTDPLTGCFNRRAILERLQAELARASREGQSLGVGMFDIDHFKSVNDLHGHSSGDEVLCEFVRRLEKELRISDMYGRVGGEEFLSLWPAADLQSTFLVAERIRAIVGKAPFLENKMLHVTVSIGVTVSKGGEAPEIVMGRADQALYTAKQNGRNRVETA